MRIMPTVVLFCIILLGSIAAGGYIGWLKEQPVPRKSATLDPEVTRLRLRLLEAERDMLLAKPKMNEVRDALHTIDSLVP